jgi:hypothetical protein
MKSIRLILSRKSETSPTDVLILPHLLGVSGEALTLFMAA